MPRLKLDPGLILAGLLSLFAAWPLLSRAGLPTATDADIHILRTQQILTAWQGGVGYTRWAPDLAYGFGYPVFNYYAPLTYYLAAAYGRFGGGAVAGVKFVLVLAAGLSSVGMYLLGRRLGRDPAAALVGAAAFALAPYLVYLNPLARGVMPETLAVALGPWLFWIFHRLRQTPSALNFSLATLLLAALLLSHNLMSFVFAALLLAWLGWETFAPGTAGKPRARFLALGALGCAAGLTAFFYLPAFVERGATQFERAFAAVRDPATPLQFVAPTTLLAPVGAADTADPTVAGWQFRLGLPQWALAGLSLTALFHKTAARRTVIFFGLSAVVLIGLMLPGANGLWKSGLPLIYLQLPWRLMGPAALALALLAGAAIAALSDGRAAAGGHFSFVRQPSFLACVATAAIILSARPLLDPLPWAAYGPTDFQRLFLYEQAGNVGTTAQNEFLPRTVQAMPAPRDSLIASYANGPVDKIDYSTLPPGAQAGVLAHGPLGDRFTISSPVDFTLRVFTLSFPGWTAKSDGQPISLTPSTPEGFITLPVAAGEHVLELQFQDTGPRRWGWGISAAALLTSAGIALWLARRREAAGEAEANPAPATTVGARFVLTLVVVMAAGLYFRPGRAAGDRPPIAQPQPAPLEGNLALVGYDLAPEQARPGETISLTLYWQATGRAARDASVFVHLLGPAGQPVAQSDKIRPVPDWPTDRWPVGRVLRDEHSLTLPAAAAAGEYSLRVGLWDRSSGVRFAALDENGQPLADTLLLNTGLRVAP